MSHREKEEPIKKTVPKKKKVVETKSAAKKVAKKSSSIVPSNSVSNMKKNITQESMS